MSEGALAGACALVVWFAGGGERMSAAGRAAMRGTVFVSPITVWELTRKAALGALPPLPTVEGSFAAWLGAQGFGLRALGWADAERANALPPRHKDPMDRMPIAQALNAGLPVITEDRLFAGSGVTVIR